LTGFPPYSKPSYLSISGVRGAEAATVLAHDDHRLNMDPSWPARPVVSVCSRDRPATAPWQSTSTPAKQRLPRFQHQYYAVGFVRAGRTSVSPHLIAGRKMLRIQCVGGQLSAVRQILELLGCGGGVVRRGRWFS
jgi:hypothetical protein